MRSTLPLFASLFLLATFSGKGFPTTRDLRVHFLSVGQGDCILIQTPNGRNLLVDTGYLEDVSKRISYLRNQGIKRLDAVIGTHPHSDHIGGMAQIIREFEIGRVYLPEAVANTSVFKDLLLSIQEKGLKVEGAKAGTTINLDPAIKIIFLAPIGSSYGNLNDFSAVIKVIYDKTSFLLTGDAGALSEEEMIKSGADLKSDVLKVGHHGGSDATSFAFLEKVAPKYAVISVGPGNSYGHPDKETLARLALFDISVFRTDIDGTISFISDGKTLRAQKQLLEKRRLTW
jgi:beta-lactamase superfamily II metal-dependent hydrolase